MSIQRMEENILRNLLENDEFARKVMPFIQEDYFDQKSERCLFSAIKEFSIKYKNLPSKEALMIKFNGELTLNDKEVDSTKKLIDELFDYDMEKPDLKWLIDETEKWCQDRALFNGISESIQILDGKTKKTKNAIPEILTKALSVSFDGNIGHDYVEDSENRFDTYHKTETHIPFDLDILNKATNGGFVPKTLNVIMAGPHAGKTLFMCHFAASFLSQGKNVLYITCEMAEEKIAERIDANLLDIPIEDIKTMPKNVFEKRMDKLKQKTQGKLIIKEYPTATAHSGHFRSLLDDLALKKKFKPEIIFVDYLNICLSSRFKNDQGANSYTVVKSIGEELRGLAVEKKAIIISATQTNRTGSTDSDVGMTGISESFGIPAIADLMWALIVNETMIKQKQILVKQLKNRYKDLNLMPKFLIGVDRPKFRLFELTDNAQNDIISEDNEENETPAVKTSFIPKKDKFKKLSGLNIS